MDVLPSAVVPATVAHLSLSNQDKLIVAISPVDVLAFSRDVFFGFKWF